MQGLFEKILYLSIKPMIYGKVPQSTQPDRLPRKLTK